MPHSSLTERIRYFFDNTLSRGTLALLIWLAVLISIVIIAVSVLVWGTGIGGDDSLTEQAWIYLMTTFAVIDADIGGNWAFRIASLIVILCGIFVMSTLISILTTGIDSKLVKISRGRSRVIEAGHTVILGWTEEIFTLIQELLIANENHPGFCIAILANLDKVEMETKINETFGSSKTTRIVCRTGNPMVVKDLDIVSLNTSKSIIVLGVPDDVRGMAVLKTILAISNNPNRSREPYHIVTSTNDQKILDSVKLIGGDEVEIIHRAEFISKIEAQTVMQPGLPLVCVNLLDFDGDEFYFKKEPDLTGKTYCDVSFAYDTSTVVGFLNFEGIPLLNPPAATVLGDHDQIIAISSDDDTVIMSNQIHPPIDDSLIQSAVPTPLQPRHMLILGWNTKTLMLIKNLSSYAVNGSTLTVAANSSDAKSQIEKISPSTELTLQYIQIDPDDRHQLEKLPFDGINNVIILPSYEIEPTGDIERLDKLDTGTILTLLNVRNIRHKRELSLTIISEILNLKNRELVDGAENDDFVVSDQLVSLAISQISENKVLREVFNKLFEPEGAEVYLKPVTNYVKVEHPVNFFTIVKSALSQNETAIGYRINAMSKTASAIKDDTEMTYGVVLNPDKRKSINFSNGDMVIVLAESAGS